MVMLFFPPGPKLTAQEMTSSHIILGEILSGYHHLRFHICICVMDSLSQKVVQWACEDY